MKTETEEKCKFRLEEFIEELPCDCPETIEDPNHLNTCDRCLALKTHHRDQGIIRELVESAKQLQKQIGNGQPFHEAENKMLRAIERAEARHV